MDAGSFFGELALATFRPTAVVANVVHDHAPLPIVRVAVVAVRPDVDTPTCGSRDPCPGDGAVPRVRVPRLGSRIASPRPASRALEERGAGHDEGGLRARLSGANAKSRAMLVRRVLEHGFGVALAVEHGDHSFVELVVLGGVASRCQRRCALLGGIRGLLAGHIALAVGAFPVPVGPVAVPASCVAFAPGRAFEFRVPRWVSRAVAVAFLAFRLVACIA
eukprot:2575325-Pleurochrysis_carterae.AAC.2